MDIVVAILGFIAAFAGGIFFGKGLSMMNDYMESTVAGVVAVLLGSVMIIAGLLLSLSNLGVIVL